MKTITFNAFEYRELKPTAQEKAREWYRRGSEGDSDWSESVIEDAKECGKFLGFDIENIYFTGFWSQGDGACFAGDFCAAKVNAAGLRDHAPKDKELHLIAEAMAAIANKFPNASFHVQHRGHYSHRFCTDFTVDLTGEDEVAMDEIGEAAANAGEKQLIETARDYMEWIYRSLEKEWKYQNSDSTVSETIEANQYHFTEEGKRPVALN